MSMCPLSCLILIELVNSDGYTILEFWPVNYRVTPQYLILEQPKGSNLQVYSVLTVLCKNKKQLCPLKTVCDLNRNMGKSFSK